jgi:hypothetical protein
VESTGIRSRRRVVAVEIMAHQRRIAEQFRRAFPSVSRPRTSWITKRSDPLSTPGRPPSVVSILGLATAGQAPSWSISPRAAARARPSWAARRLDLLRRRALDRSAGLQDSKLLRQPEHLCGHGSSLPAACAGSLHSSKTRDLAAAHSRRSAGWRTLAAASTGPGGYSTPRSAAAIASVESDEGSSDLRFQGRLSSGPQGQNMMLTASLVLNRAPPPA